MCTYRDQDLKITDVKAKKEEVETRLAQAIQDTDSLKLSVQQLKDQNALLKAQKGIVRECSTSVYIIIIITELLCYRKLRTFV